jgi:hypothetical protein
MPNANGTMMLRQAAALTLLGWYLMMPPAIDFKTIDTHAPLSHWTQFSGYDSVAACEQDGRFRGNNGIR